MHNSGLVFFNLMLERLEIALLGLTVYLISLLLGEYNNFNKNVLDFSLYYVGVLNKLVLLFRGVLTGDGFLF